MLRAAGREGCIPQHQELCIKAETYLSFTMQERYLLCQTILYKSSLRGGRIIDHVKNDESRMLQADTKGYLILS